MARTSFRIRALTCPQCGAKLRWEREAPIIECRYCHTHVVVETGRRTEHPANIVSSKPSRLPFAIAGAFIACAFVAVVTTMSMRGGARPSTHASAPAKMSTVAELLATPLRSTPEQVAARHGVRVHGSNVRVVLSDGAFGEVGLHWDETSREHLRSITLSPRRADAPLDDVVTRARSLLGRRLRASGSGDHQFHTKNVSFRVGSTVQALAQVSADADWQSQLAAMWIVMKAAAFDTGETLDERTRRDVLNIAYPLSVLHAIGIDVKVDDARRTVLAAAPGADIDGARHAIGLEHPWFESMYLTWNNQPAGAWTSATLYFAKEVDFAVEHPKITACVAPVLGEPKRLVSDHLAGTFTLQFPSRNGAPWVDIGPATFQFYPDSRHGATVTAAGLAALVDALTACVRE